MKMGTKKVDWNGKKWLEIIITQSRGEGNVEIEGSHVQVKKGRWVIWGRFFKVNVLFCGLDLLSAFFWDSFTLFILSV